MVLESGVLCDLQTSKRVHQVAERLEKMPFSQWKAEIPNLFIC